MLITKFNKMIRNRLLWGAFAALISIAFVFSFSGGDCRDDDAGDKRTPGRLYGEEVSRQELEEARYFEWGLQRNEVIPPEAQEPLTQQAWRRLAAVRTAERIGTRVTDLEVAKTIQRDPTFRSDNTFDPTKYRTFVLRRLRMPVGLFEKYLEQELTLEKMRSLAASMTWVSPMEIRFRISNLLDQRQIEYITLDRAEHTPEVDVSRGDAMAFYEAHTNMFRRPDKVSVKYVRFEFTNFVGQVSVLDTNVHEYYEDNIESYTTAGTNDEDVVTPLEEVRDDIAAALREQKAADLAMETATRLVVALAPGRYGSQGVSFEKAAAARSLTVHTTRLFSATEEITGLEVGPDFRETAFELEPNDPERYFSDAIRGTNAAFVIASHEQVPAYVPPFEEIEEQVTEEALSDARDKAFANRVSEIRTDLQDALAEEKSFADAATGMGFNVSTTQPFSVYGGLPETSKAPETLGMGVIGLDQNEISEPLETADGRMLAYCAKRISADPGQVRMLIPQLQDAMVQYRSGIIFREWVEFMLKQAGFEDLSRPSAEAEPTAEDADAEPAPTDEA